MNRNLKNKLNFLAVLSAIVVFTCPGLAFASLTVGSVSVTSSAGLTLSAAAGSGTIVGDATTAGSSLTLQGGSTGTIILNSTTVSFAKEVNHTLNVATSTTAATAGGNLTVTTGAGNGGASGNLTLSTVSMTGQNTGTVILRSGNSTTSGNTGTISIISGNSTTSGTSGTISLTTGNSNGASGSISLTTGNSTTAAAGSITIEPGAGVSLHGAVNIGVADQAIVNLGGEGTTLNISGKLNILRGTGSVSADAVDLSTFPTGSFTDSTNINTDTTRAPITLTLTNSTVNSVILVSICSTPDAGARLGVAATPGAGSVTITVWNSGTANQTSDYKVCYALLN